MNVTLCPQQDEGVEQQTAVLTVPVSTGKSTIEGSAGGGGTPADAAVGDGRQGELEDSQVGPNWKKIISYSSCCITGPRIGPGTEP